MPAIGEILYSLLPYSNFMLFTNDKAVLDRCNGISHVSEAFFIFQEALFKRPAICQHKQQFCCSNQFHPQSSQFHR